MPGLASERKGDLSFSQVKLYGESRHFVYVRVLIMRKILRSTGCAMQLWGITLKFIDIYFIIIYHDDFDIVVPSSMQDTCHT